MEMRCQVCGEAETTCTCLFVDLKERREREESTLEEGERGGGREKFKGIFGEGKGKLIGMGARERG